MPAYNYGCVIDAGSSGSRIYIYRWPTNQNNTDEFIKVLYKPIFSNEMRPSVSSLDGDIETLVELVSSAKDALPNVELSSVPIYLGATAGLRLSEEADSIMTNIRSTLHKSGFMFQDDYARILTGNEESMYGWIVANYLNDSLGPSSTFGALDLGGGSTQISLSVPTTTTKEDELYPLKIGNINYPLYTQSYLSYGADQARTRFEAEFLQQSNVNPCYGSGYTDEDTGILGTSNWDECFDSVSKLFEHNSHLRGGKTDLSIISPPPTQEQQRYIAMSVFVFIWDFLGLNTGEETDDLNTLTAKAKEICNLTYTQQTNQYDKQMEDKPDGRKTNKPFAQCFNAAYTYHLLSEGYQLPVSDTPIQVHYEINGGKVEWSLGMMLVEANKLHTVKDESMTYSTHSYLFLSSVLLALLILVSLYVRSRRVLLNPFRKGSSFQR